MTQAFGISLEDKSMLKIAQTGIVGVMVKWGTLCVYSWVVDFWVSLAFIF